MRKLFSNCLFAVTAAILMSSCYSHKYAVGNGPQTGVTVTEKNNFFVYGLIPGKVSDPQKMADGAQDFEITQVHTFTDGLIGVITFGIYTPTTTKVQR